MMNSKMKIRIIGFFLIFSLIRVANAQPSDEERQTPGTDHFLVYMTGIVGGGVAHLMVYCFLDEALRDLHSARPTLYEGNMAAARMARIFFPLGGIVVGSAVGYLLECFYLQSE